MKITIESTDVITTYNGAKTRVWKGVTENGVECGVFVAGVAVHESKDLSQFEAELEAMKVPTELRSLGEVFQRRMF